MVDDELIFSNDFVVVSINDLPIFALISDELDVSLESLIRTIEFVFSKFSPSDNPKFINKVSNELVIVIINTMN